MHRIWLLKPKKVGERDREGATGRGKRDAPEIMKISLILWKDGMLFILLLLKKASGKAQQLTAGNNLLIVEI